MLLNCNLSQCLTHCALTAIAVIVFTIVLDIILYFAYAYFTVRRYYSSDLKSQRDTELAKYGYTVRSNTGSIGTKTFQWKEVFPPADNNADNIPLKTVTVNDKWIWGTTERGEIYMCKKPCDGTSEDTFWYKIPGQLRQLSANNNIIWGVNNKNKVFLMNNPSRSGKWKLSPARLKHVSVGQNGTVWGTNTNDKIYECKTPYSCSKGVAKNISSVQVVVGSSFVWSLDSKGNISQKSTSQDAWTDVKAPARVIQIAVGKSDRLFALSEDFALYELVNSKWSTVEDAPTLRFISTMSDSTNEIYGISDDNKLWLGEF